MLSVASTVPPSIETGSAATSASMFRITAIRLSMRPSAVALDDCGSGLCRLNTLTQFPLAIVKLDELVTGHVDDDPLQREFVRAVVASGARGITTVAEYTRSPEQLQRLVEDGVDLFQGERFGMPVPAAAAVEVCIEWRGATHTVGTIHPAAHGESIMFRHATEWLARRDAFAIDPVSLPLGGAGSPRMMPAATPAWRTRCGFTATACRRTLWNSGGGSSTRSWPDGGHDQHFDEGETV
jgi:hypothetical protein